MATPSGCVAGSLRQCCLDVAGMAPAMNYRFDHTITSVFTELRLVGPAGEIPVDDRAVEAPSDLLPGVDLVLRMRAADAAFDEGSVLFIEHSAIAGLTAREAELIALSPLAEAVASVSTSGLINRPDFTADLQWKRPTGRNDRRR